MTNFFVVAILASAGAFGVAGTFALYCHNAKKYAQLSMRILGITAQICAVIAIASLLFFAGAIAGL